MAQTQHFHHVDKIVEIGVPYNSHIRPGKHHGQQGQAGKHQNSRKYLKPIHQLQIEIEADKKSEKSSVKDDQAINQYD